MEALEAEVNELTKKKAIRVAEMEELAHMAQCSREDYTEKLKCMERDIADLQDKLACHQEKRMRQEANKHYLLDELHCLEEEQSILKEELTRLEAENNRLKQAPDKLPAGATPTIPHFTSLEEAVVFLRSELEKEVAAREALQSEFLLAKQKWANPHFCY